MRYLSGCGSCKEQEKAYGGVVDAGRCGWAGHLLRGHGGWYCMRAFRSIVCETSWIQRVIVHRCMCWDGFTFLTSCQVTL